MTTKGARYVELLQDARCEGTWSEVPELVRKVRKHMPARECLALTAETECAVSKVTSTGARPSSASASARDLDVANRFQKLMDAVAEENRHAEDRFQARVCIGWMFWAVADYTPVLEGMPRDLTEGYTSINVAETSEWTSVCALKAAYLRANCLMREGDRVEALVALRAALPSLARVWCGHGIRKQLRYWSELFLTEYCMLSSESLHNNEVTLDDPESIACFRSWAKYWEVMSAPVTGGFSFKGSVPRRKIWSEYYLALSRILENDLPFPAGNMDQTPSDMSPRSQLRVELRRAEAAYQALILTETTFPRADEERAEVEAFVKQVMLNWAVLCGRGWREQDLGQGGRHSLSRGVLDILYSAATRTYHSTAILRSLFRVHLAVADFDLAFKALDSYLDIVKKGKARVAKTGHLEPSLDEDGIVLETVAQGIMALCRYGHQQAAEKARDLGSELEGWISKLPQRRKPSEIPPEGEGLTTAPPQTIALAWQAIGLAHAHWSRITSEAGSRAEIQSNAIRCLRRSLAPELGRSKDVRSFFCLGLLLAERRELAAAIEAIRTALMCSQGYGEDYNLFYGPYWQERSLIPLWHLLALLLSAKQDYAMAAKTCEGAFEQFKDLSVLFGRADGGFRSEHLNDADVKNSESRGLVDEMDDSEKESILDVKMTQLTLIELLEGPDVAVNASYEVVNLYHQLFGSVDVQPTLKPPVIKEPPKTSGTLRTIKGSIFGSHRARPATRHVSAAAALSEMLPAATPSRPATSYTSAASIAPTVQVTGENGDTTDLPRPRSGSLGQQQQQQQQQQQHHHHHLLHHHQRQRSQSGRRNSLKKKGRSDSRQRSLSTGGLSHQATSLNGETEVVEDANDFFSFSGRRLHSRVPNSVRGRTVSAMNSYLSSSADSVDYSEPSTDSFTLPYIVPLMQFPRDKESTRRKTILIRVWLMIAGFYRRAGVLGDCKNAVTEAQRLVQQLETDSNELAGAGGSKGPAWAERKSIDELWGDIYSELGHLSLALDTPYTARSNFESALTHYPDHPAAIVGLSNILLDISSERLLPSPAIPPLDGSEVFDDAASYTNSESFQGKALKILPHAPLGLSPDPASELLAVSSEDGEDNAAKATASSHANHNNNNNNTNNKTNDDDDDDDDNQLPAPYKATRLPLVDRLAARDRAYTLLSGLTRLGTGWDYSDAWFALARAHEENGQVDKAKEVLWWCVELEEAMGVRDWRCLAGGGYVL